MSSAAAADSSQGLRRRLQVGIGWSLVDALVAAWQFLRLHRIGRAGHYLLVVPALLAVGVLATALGYLAWRSLHSFDPFLYQQGGFSTDNLRDAVTDSFYRGVFLRTLAGSVIVSIISVSLALPMAYAMVHTQSRTLRLLLLLASVIPFLVGEVVRAYSWLVVLGANGTLPWLTRSLGLGSLDLMGTFPGVLLGLTQLMVPLCALTLLPALRAIEPELEQAAATMGARRWTTWRTVVLPLARPGIVGAAALSFALCMTSFAIPALIGRGIQDFTANTIYDVYLRASNVNMGAALAMLIVAVVVLGIGLIYWIGKDREWGMRAGARERRAAEAAG